MFHMDPSGTWSLGVLVGIPLLVVFALLIAAFAGLGAKYDTDLFPPAAYIIGGGVSIAVVIGFALSPMGYYPYKGEYHQWRDVSGTVTQIDKRLIGSGKAMEDKFVVRFDGSALQFGCDDTRCAQVREGDALTLSCKRAWQYTGTDGYDCRFVSTGAAA